MQTIVHIIIDEKFIETALVRFEAVAPGVSRYIIPGRQVELKYIKDTNVEFLTESEICSLVSTCNHKALIVHSLPLCMADILESVHSETAVCWLGWGFDYYGLLLGSFYPDGLLLSRTKELVKTIDHIRKEPFHRRLAKRCIVEVSRLCCGRKIPPSLNLERIDYFCPVLELEHRMAIEANPLLRAKYIPWNYQGQLIAEPRTPCTPQHDPGLDIFIGNSATSASNHADVFEWIAATGSHCGRKIIVPLNYGDMVYADEVCKLGESLFGKLFVPLRQWMPINEYYKLVGCCGIALFGHLRQQAAGIVRQMMKQGSKVYMHSSSPLFQESKSQGAHLFALDTHMDEGVPIDFSPLSIVEREENLRVSQMFHEYAPYSRTRNLVEILLKSRSLC
jgi:dTDP-N-acetylfucosamine:lipid II N-acetylfucosaminyltransferase